MLKLIVSPPGTGKTTYITEKIREDAEFSAAAPILLVPEQSHFETERMVYKRLGSRCFAKTEILSFTKLGAKIIADFKAEKAYASDAVREITLFRIARELKNQLRFYGGVCEKPDFAARMLNVIEIFQREGISPQELSVSASEIKNTRLRAKTSDIALIYGRYTAQLNERFSDRADQIRVAAGLVFQQDYFVGKNIFIDGFDGFTGGQFLLIDAMISKAQSVTVSITADRLHSRDSRYLISAQLAQKLINYAEKKHKEIAIEKLYKNPMFDERNVQENTELFLLSDIHEESNFVAAKIRELITTGNYSQSEIAVLNPPSPETLSGAFSTYGISEFTDIPEAIIEKPWCKFIITVMEAAEGRQGAILDMIQSGFVRVNAKKTRRICRKNMKHFSQMEQRFGPDEKDWYKPFPSGITSANAEKIRAEITGKIAEFSAKITDTTGDKITEELAKFLINEMEITRTIADIVYRGKKVDTALNDEYRNLWDKVIGVLEAMHAALKNQKISPGDYKSVLISVFGKTMTSKPPQVIDAVTVGDLRRTRTANIKVVFLMGASQGEFPKSNFSGAEFTENENDELCDSGIFIDENRTDKFYRDKFLINRAMTLPTEKLYITAPQKDQSQKKKQPARIFSEQKNKVKDVKKIPLEFWASHEIALKFKAAETPHKGALTEALRVVDEAEYLRLFGDVNKSYKHKIDSEIAVALMKKKTISPGAIEKLNTCNFKYFCSSGLRIEKGRISGGAEPDALTRGSMVHYVLERVLRDYEGRNYKDFIEINPAEFVRISEKYLHEFEQKEYADGWARSARKKDILISHAAGIAEVLKQMREEMEASEFRPFAFEKMFEFLLGDIPIKGKADRLDVLVNGDYSYVRVIDYKTGEKKFSYPEIEFGLNMQALIYLFAITSLDKKFKPSGAFYRLVNGGKLSKKSLPYGIAQAAENPHELYKKRMETQATAGIQFVGENRIDSLDIEKINSKIKANLPSRTRKNFIEPVNLNEEEFTHLVEKTSAQLKNKLNEIYSGNIVAVPVYSGKSPCVFCDYKIICNNAGKFEEIKI
ncbi:MAG: PD-(D/E)XK nuclease family protein [Oscillospiraceae bacterium]|nr:PD-(D/E)XK nuclease family protein [Oscillospiraceae bacterium]